MGWSNLQSSAATQEPFLQETESPPPKAGEICKWICQEEQSQAAKPRGGRCWHSVCLRSPLIHTDPVIVHQVQRAFLPPPPLGFQCAGASGSAVSQQPACEHPIPLARAFSGTPRPAWSAILFPSILLAFLFILLLCLPVYTIPVYKFLCLLKFIQKKDWFLVQLLFP